MNKKNIWIINQYTGSPYHGMNYRSYYLAKEFIKNGHSVTIFSSSFSHLFRKYPDIKSTFTEENIDGINYIWVKTPKYKSSKSLGRFINMLTFMINLFFFNTKKTDKPDEIIISSLSLFPVLNAYFWSKKFKIKFIFEVRDLWPRTLVDLGNISWKHPLVKFLGWFEKFGYEKSKYIVSVLPNAKEHIKTVGNYDSKFRYIPNGIIIDNNYGNLDQNVLDMIPQNKFIVGYVGTIGIANAMEYLIETAKLLNDDYKNIHFVLVGDGGEKKNLVNLVNNYKLTNITFIPSILKKQVQNILKYFDICYLGWHDKELYRFGTSANKTFDYMLSSTPVIQSINTKNDVVELSKCGWNVESENIEKLKEKILEVEKLNKKELLKIGENGFKYVTKFHDYKYLASKYEELFI